MSPTHAEPSDEELKTLIQQLTLEEKISLLAGKSTWETASISRLDIPSLKVSDGPNGARGSDFLDGTTAACFPASVSLAATFNPGLVRRIGVALGQETQTKGAYCLLGPTVCIHRSPVGGRNFEAFSEDPFLTGQLAAEYVLGLQSERVSATVKHFAANEQDTKRFCLNEKVSDRALREIYLRAFEIVVKKADPWSIMTSYPRVNGTHIDAQPKFMQDILRGEWGYKGLIMTDWGAASAAAKSIKYGLDLEMPGPPLVRTQEAVQEALDSGLIHESDIDKRTFAVLDLVRKTGKFSDRRERVEEKAVDLPEHRQVIRQAGSEGIVLLKNENAQLPLAKTGYRKIALVGPLAQYAAAHGGGSASLNCHYVVSPYDAFRARLGPEVEITYAPGAHIIRSYPELQAGTVTKTGTAGFLVELFKADDLSGAPFHTEECVRGLFMTLMNSKAVGSRSARLSTTYTPAESGSHYVSFSGMGPSKLYINNKLVSQQTTHTKNGTGFILGPGASDEHRFQYHFEAGVTHDIVIESWPLQVDPSDLGILQGTIAARLGFITQREMEADLLGDAVAAAKEADVVVCFVGNTTQWETEGRDMTDMKLPADGSQNRLVAAVAAVNPRTVVAVTTGVPVEMPWLEDVPAVIQAWYAGQETGNAIFDVLFGEANPGGKLPMSWPKKYEHTGCYGHFGMDSFESEEVEYVEGVNVGYRHFDQKYGTDKEVLFPFGFGLSYSTFEIRDVVISGSLDENRSDDTVTVSMTIVNTGSQGGTETAQVYVAPADGAGNGRPPKALVAFSKVFLGPGETKRVTTSFGRDGAAYWVEDVQMWRVDSGRHAVLVGTSSSPRDVKARLELDVSRGFDFCP